MDKMPGIKLDKINGETFIGQIMKPHTPYYKAIKNISGIPGVHGMAHITGGGIEGNLCRIIPDGLCAEIDLSLLKPLPVFSYIQKAGNIDTKEMLATFNCGAGLNIIVSKDYKDKVISEIKKFYDCYEIGNIIKSNKKILFRGNIAW